MTEEQRQQYIEKLTKRRAEINKQIAEASKQRQEFIAAERAKMAEAAGEESANATLGEAMAEAVHEQLQTSGFDFKKD